MDSSEKIVDGFIARVEKTIKEAKEDPEKQAKLDAYLKKIDDDRERERSATEDCIGEIYAVLRKWFGNTEVFKDKRTPGKKKDTPKLDSLQGKDILAAALQYFDLGDENEPGQLYVEWAIEKFTADKIYPLIPDVLFLHEQLFLLCTSEENKYEYNDMDNHLWYVETYHPRKKAFCMSNQNRTYLVLINQFYGRHSLHIRRIWENFDEEHYWQSDKVNNIKDAIIAAGGLVERYSDCYPENRYIRRPNLRYFKDRHFKLKYSDFRDEGYILSTGGYNDDKIDGAAHYWTDIKWAVWELIQSIELAKAGFDEY